MTSASETTSPLGAPWSVAVIGAGPRGRAFAGRCAQAGLEVILEDVLSSNLRKAEAQLAHAAPSLAGHVHFVGSVEDAVRHADIAIDFVPDELESKLEIFSMMDRMAPPRTILCTPTTLSVTDLASCTYRADRCIGLALGGEDLIEPVLLLPGEATSQATITAVEALIRRLGAEVSVSHAEFVSPLAS